MPTVSQHRAYAGFLVLSERLGLSPLIADLTGILTGFHLRMAEQKIAKSGGIRKILDGRLKKGGWGMGGSARWTKYRSIDGTRVGVAVELGLSQSRGLLVACICRLRDASTAGDADVGVLVVSDNEFMDRCPKFSDAVSSVRTARAEDFPLLILGIRHDGPGEPLAKQFKAQQKRSE